MKTICVIMQQNSFLHMRSETDNFNFSFVFFFFPSFFPNCSSDATYKCDYMMKISVVARILSQLNCFIVRTEILEILKIQ